MTRKNERFLFYNSIDDVHYTERMILYATKANLRLLREQPDWIVVSTFAVSPVIFSQLNTVHVLLPEGKSVPVVYALLASEAGSTYNKMLNKISETLGGFHPQVVHVDFETMILVIETVFPSAGILACSFHLIRVSGGTFRETVCSYANAQTPIFSRNFTCFRCYNSSQSTMCV